ncbi:MAG: cupin domain-containing protein [Methylobacteriaceae bacterium]|jgi:quercetin dioxygenase-like cupin family protein|nr:cupin domain-containing protein [Methylobacteriaceae bacterium]
MTHESFFISHEVPWAEAGPGVKRQVLAHTPEMMIVRVKFEKGAVGSPHTHPHVQSCLVEDGVFEVTVAGVTKRLQKGDGYLVKSDVEHGAVALEAGALIDIFTPRRDDFLK